MARKSPNLTINWGYDGTLMSVTKLKPARAPRLMDEWTEQAALACNESKRVARDTIERSKKLVEQSKEIKARMEATLKKDPNAKAS